MMSNGLKKAVDGKVVVVTGSSDGIGARLAARLALAGAKVALVARSADKLKEVGDDIRAQGGVATEHVANLSDEADVDRVLQDILKEHNRVDILVSNAGRSIRRSVKYQAQDRFHDFQRLMALNYFGALRLVLNTLPGMTEQGAGQIIHVSSFGVPTRQPRFAGYAASKAAMDAALQCAAGEVASKGVSLSTVYMPLVATKMVKSKGHSYDHVSMLSVDEACEYIEHAIITKRAEVIDSPSRFLSMLYAWRPNLINSLNALVYRLETEVAPDGVGPRVSSRKQVSSKKTSKGPSPLLKFLASLMWFFSRAELTLAVRWGVPWMARDILAVIVMTLVLVIQPIVAVLFSSVKGVRRALRGTARRSEVIAVDAKLEANGTADGPLIDEQFHEPAPRSTLEIAVSPPRGAANSGRDAAGDVPRELLQAAPAAAKLHQGDDAVGKTLTQDSDSTETPRSHTDSGDNHSEH